MALPIPAIRLIQKGPTGQWSDQDATTPRQQYLRRRGRQRNGHSDKHDLGGPEPERVRPALAATAEMTTRLTVATWISISGILIV